MLMGCLAGLVGVSWAEKRRGSKTVQRETAASFAAS